MKRILSAFLCALLLCLALTVTAFADYDEIVSYDLVVTPHTEDGSLSITATFDWKALEALDYGTPLKIGIPNGSIREEMALTDNIERLDYDNSYMYVYLDSGIKRNDEAHFSYSWVQEYMYTLSDNGGVSYDYTPGWFDDIRIDHMSVTWNDPAGVSGGVTAAGNGGSWQQNGQSWQADGLSYGAQIRVTADYPSWPTELYWENSAENYEGGWDDGWDDGYSDNYYDDTSDAIVGLFTIILMIVIISLVIAAKRSRNSYVGGFGSGYVHPTYVYVGGLWYPAGPDHKPRPGSVGLAHKPPTPAPRPKSGSSSSSGGFGGGSRGGGFGSSGFGGGSRGCACASSCACACACACAGGGRAGCSAKNLYGAVRLNKELTKNLKH